jgi:hypothetical protein
LPFLYHYRNNSSFPAKIFNYEGPSAAKPQPKSQRDTPHRKGNHREGTEESYAFKSVLPEGEDRKMETGR